VRARIHHLALGLLPLMLAIGACSDSKSTPPKKQSTRQQRVVSGESRLFGEWRIDIPRLVDDMSAKDPRILSLDRDKGGKVVARMKKQNF